MTRGVGGTRRIKKNFATRSGFLKIFQQCIPTETIPLQPVTVIFLDSAQPQRYGDFLMFARALKNFLTRLGLVWPAFRTVSLPWTNKRFLLKVHKVKIAEIYHGVWNCFNSFNKRNGCCKVNDIIMAVIVEKCIVVSHMS